MKAVKEKEIHARKKPPRVPMRAKGMVSRMMNG